MYVEALYADPDGKTLWIGGSEGLYRYDASIEKDYDRPYPALVRKVATADSVFYWGDFHPDTIDRRSLAIRPALLYAQNSLKFEFSASDYEDEERLFFRYQLIGYDTGWSGWSRQAEKEYTNLFEGNYTFEVQAKNVYGTLSNIGRYHFRVLPPWYRTWYAYATYLLLAMAGIRLGVRLYTRKLKADKERLEGIVSERTSEIMQKTNEIVKQKEEIEGQANSLKTAYERLKELEDFKDGLTGMVAHDLKNPLNTLMGIASQYPDFQPMQQVSQASQQMLRMVMDMLDIQKLEDPHLQIAKITVSLYSLAQEAIEAVRLLSEEKRIDVQNLVPADTHAMADASLLLRVFENLLTNAIKYSPVGGQVRIMAGEAADGQVCCTVADQGKGIPTDMQRRIFDKFTQLEAKNSGKARSTGLGLAFCKLAIEAHGGRIWVESEVGKGSMFKFLIEGKAGAAMMPIAERQSTAYTDADWNQIAQWQAQLAGFQLYQGASIMPIIAQAKAEATAGAKIWLLDLEACVLAYEEARFEELMQMKKP